MTQETTNQEIDPVIKKMIDDHMAKAVALIEAQNRRRDEQLERDGYAVSTDPPF